MVSGEERIKTHFWEKQTVILKKHENIKFLKSWSLTQNAQ